MHRNYDASLYPYLLTLTYNYLHCKLWLKYVLHFVAVSEGSASIQVV